MGNPEIPLDLMALSYPLSGGWNNNPTVQQFIGAFRKLIARAGASTSGSTGNVIAQDCTEIVRAATSSYLPPRNIHVDEDDGRDIDRITISSFSEVDQSEGQLDPLKHGKVIDNILVYISGFVVKKVFAKLSCIPCRDQLICVRRNLDSSHILLTIKNRGGLFVPSEPVVKIVTVTERTLRSVSDLRMVSRSTMEKQKVISKVVSVLGNQNLFCEVHDRDSCVGIERHSFDLIRMIAGVFYDLRVHHIAHLHNQDVQKKALRNKLTRNIIFMGQ